MGWLDFATALIQKIPIERFLFQPRSDVERLERLQSVLTASEDQSKPPIPTGKTIGTQVQNIPSAGVPKIASQNRLVAPQYHPAGTAVAEATLEDLPTSEETKEELKRRLSKELYRAELDLQGKLRIMGKPCDCLDLKHSLGIEATAEELISHEPDNPVYEEVITWLRVNQPKLTIEAIKSGKYDNEYPKMASEFRGFRKQIVGTESRKALITPR